MVFESPIAPLTLTPIGVVHSPLTERMRAPRQPSAAISIEGTIELFPQNGILHALEDLASFRYIWVLFWFHKNRGFRPKVLPPRSTCRRGVFATRSPYRPNPLGLSVVELLGIEGRILRVRNLDMLDTTPVLDLKPYLPYADSIPDASSGWLEHPSLPEDPITEHQVTFSSTALEQLEFLERRGISLRGPIEDVLRLGPEPHPYRRIKRAGSGYVLAHKEWRCDFSVEERTISVSRVKSGYRPSEIFGSTAPELAVHREFVERFG